MESKTLNEKKNKTEYSEEELKELGIFLKKNKKNKKSL